MSSTTKVTDQLLVLAMAVEAADKNLGQANAEMTAFRNVHPEFFGRLVLRPQHLTPLDLEFRGLQEKVNFAQAAFTAACIKYADAKPD